MQVDLFGSVNTIPAFKKPPIPFLGNKGHYLPTIARIARKSNESKIIDLFGGSGIISHEMNRIFPDKKVIWNDYDDFRSRLSKLSDMQDLYRTFRDFCYEHGVKNEKKLPKKIALKFYNDHIKDFPEEKFDALTVSLFATFGGRVDTKKKADFERFPLWFRHLSLNDFGEYLRGVERVKMDAFDVLVEHEGLIIADPPYVLKTGKTFYKDNSFSLEDSDRLIQIIKRGDFMFFTSNKSEVSKLESLKGLHVHRYEKRSYKSTYTDMLFTNIDVTKI